MIKFDRQVLLVVDTGSQETSDQAKQRFVADLLPEQRHEKIMIDSIEEFGQIHVDGELACALNGHVHPSDRIVCRAAAAKAVAVFKERGIKQGRERLDNGLR